MEIRRAKYCDIPRIIELLEQVLTVHHEGRPDVFKSGAKKYDENMLTCMLSDDKTVIFVAENATRVLGYCFCMIKETHGDTILKDMKTLYIDDLCIDEGERGQGVGRALFEYARAYAKELGCYNLTLNVWECNTGAKAFYERLGLVPQKTILETIL